MSLKTCYKALGLAPGALLHDVKRAYHALALQLHPDKNPSADAAARFCAVQAAYNVLVDRFARPAECFDDESDDDEERQKARALYRETFGRLPARVVYFGGGPAKRARVEEPHAIPRGTRVTRPLPGVVLSHQRGVVSLLGDDATAVDVPRADVHQDISGVTHSGESGVLQELRADDKYYFLRDKGKRIMAVKPEDAQLPVGTSVWVKGLEAQTELNGSVGVVLAVDVANRKVKVDLDERVGWLSWAHVRAYRAPQAEGGGA